MKLAIVGSRILPETDENLAKMTEIIRRNISGITEVVSGGARGADTLADRFARQEKIPFVLFEADWEKYHRAAGPLRNAKVVNYCDKLIAFYINEEKSKGTRDAVKRAKAEKKLLVTYEWYEVEELVKHDLTSLFD